jgi:ATP-dependent DNA ligase
MFVYPNKPIRTYNPVGLLPALGDLSNWVVQPKWDGKRVEIECTETGTVTLYGREGQRFKERWPWLSDLPLPKPWFLDGELLRDGRIFIWDAAILDGEKAYREAYGPRLELLQRAVPEPLTQQGQTIACIETLPAESYQQLLAREGEKGLEGIVWKSTKATNMWGVTSTTEVNTCFKFRFK